MTDEGDFPVQFGTVAIVGVGLIGGSLGMALKRRRVARHIIGIGRDQAKLDKAIALGAIDVGITDLVEGVTEADIVVLCTTISHILATMPEVLAAVKPGAVVTDVGSTKGTITAMAGDCPFFVGGHPMAGSERTGVEAAFPTLFQEATWAITPIVMTNAKATRTIRTLAQEVGAQTLMLSPDAHDAMVAVTSHLPHVMASALMRLASATAQPHPEIPQLAAGSFADMTRVAAAAPEIWRDVCLSNREAVLAALQGFRQEIDVLEDAVRQSDAAQIEAFFAAGALAKSHWRRS